MAISSLRIQAPARILILRGVGADGKAALISKFATGLDHPFGIAFYPAENPSYVYVGNATTIQRIPYHIGDLRATGTPETVVPDIPGYAQLKGGGHWTRDVVFTKDGKYMLVSHGSWNRAKRAGYEVIEIPMRDGHAADGSYEDFLTGFVTKDGRVWGRPVGVTIGGDGALYVSDDGSRSVWRIAYVGE